MNKPSDEQSRAILQTGMFVLRACPGSGKTFTVAKRLSKRLEEWDHPHKGIATLSFTNVAHEEISYQLLNEGNSSVPGYPHFVGTIDSFVNSWIFLPHGHLVMNCNKRPQIVGLGSNIWNPQGYKWAWKVKECNQKNCSLVNFSYNLNNEFVYIGSKNINCSQNYRRCKELKKIFSEEGFATQSDANYWAVKVLERYPQIAKALIRRFPEFIIDEGQDTSEIQMKIIDLLVENGLSEVMLVGDPDQAIYEWREANPELFVENARTWTCLELTENRRSSQLICDATQPFSTLQNASTAVGGSASFGKMPKIITYESDKETDLLSRFSEICTENGIEISPDKVAILVRSKTLLRKVSGVGKEVDPWNEKVTELLANASFYRSINEIKQAMQYLEKAVMKICFGEFNIPQIELNKLIEKKISQLDLRIGLVSLLKSLPNADESLGEWVKQTKTIVKEWLTEYSILMDTEEEVVIKVKSRITDVKDFKSRKVSSYFVKQISDDITIETIHAAKGKTFEAIMFVVGGNRSKCNMKKIAELDPDSEEVRIAYVAMTRPRKILVLAIPQESKNKKYFNDRFRHWDQKGIDV